MTKFLAALALIGLPSIAVTQTSRATPADLVDPRIGLTESRGNTVIGPTLPHGSIHPSPDTPRGANGGYRTGQPVRGFSQLHVSGTGWTTYGNFLISPQVKLAVGADAHDSPITNEVAKSYSYRARLERYGIDVAFAPTRNAALYRFDFPATGDGHVLLDLAQQLPGAIRTYQKGSVNGSEATIGDDGRIISGWSDYSGGFGGGRYRVYFAAVTDTAATSAGTFRGDQVLPGQRRIETARDERTGAWLRFARGGRVHLKIAVSFHSVDRARAHLATELPGWRLEAVESAGRAAWDKALGRIKVAGGDATQRRQFYTAMYHAQLMPRDRTGEFVRYNAKVPMYDDHYAIWDTWRTKFPLMLWIDPAFVRGNIASFVERLRVDGQVRDSFVGGNPGTFGTADQGGNDVDNIIADAWAKGLRGVDWQAAYGVMKFNADRERRGTLKVSGSRNPPGDNDHYRRFGWLPSDINNVSNTLEYAYNDYLVAQVAAGLGRADDARAYRARSGKWSYLFNPDVESDGFRGFVLPRNADGSWVPTPDLKKYPGSWKPHFYEAASWGYSFFVPHEPDRLIAMMGGRDTFVRRLEYGLRNKLVDFSNEPAFLAPALFHHAGRSDLSTKWVRRYAEAMTGPAGYPGDDDSGAMSSYYIWSSMGLFPNAGQDLYYLNAPLFDRIVVDRPEEGVLTIERRGGGPHVASVTLNGRLLAQSCLRHRELRGTARLVFTMAALPTPPRGCVLSSAALAQP